MTQIVLQGTEREKKRKRGEKRKTEKETERGIETTEMWEGIAAQATTEAVVDYVAGQTTLTMPTTQTILIFDLSKVEAATTAEEVQDQDQHPLDKGLGNTRQQT